MALWRLKWLGKNGHMASSGPVHSRRGRHGGAVPLVVVEPRTTAPMYEQIYASLREQIISGRLRAGHRLASTRTLAIELEVSRFTVVAAIDRLLAEGYLTA